MMVKYLFYFIFFISSEVKNEKEINNVYFLQWTTL